jgi:hypothetical protein
MHTEISDDIIEMVEAGLRRYHELLPHWSCFGVICHLAKISTSVTSWKETYHLG